MSEAVELNMDQIMVLKMMKLMKMLFSEEERRFQIFRGRRHATKEC
jgi:hypothetical protein